MEASNPTSLIEIQTKIKYRSVHRNTLLQKRKQAFIASIRQMTQFTQIVG